MVGGPSSRVQLPMKFSRSTGDQFAPAPIVVRVPKSDSWSTSALRVEGQVAERAELAAAARDRQVEVDRRFAASSATSEVDVPTPWRRRCCRDERCSRRASAWSSHCLREA